MRGWLGPTTGHRAALFLLTGIGYLVCAQVAYAFAIRPSGVSALWVPSGFMLALLVARDRGDWAVTLAGGFTANIAADLVHGLAVPQALLGGIANTLEAWVAAALVVRLLRGPLGLATLREVGVLVLGAGIISNAFTSLLGAAAIVQNGATGYWRAWFNWWAGDGIGMLIVAPAILTALAFARSRPAFRWRAVAEAACLSTAVAVLTQFAMSQRRDPTRIADADPYMVFPLLFWAAFRFGPVGASMATLGVAAITVWNAAQGRGPFAQAGYTATNEVLQTYAFLTLTAVSSMIVSSVIAERRAAEADAIDRSRHATLAADVATAVTERGPLRDILDRCARVMADRLRAVQVCIWTVGLSDPGLELQACAEGRPSLSGPERRPVGRLVAGDVARDGQPRVRNRRDLEVDIAPFGLPDQDRISFHGLPLKVNDHVLGVVGVLSHEPLPKRTIEALASVARTLALGVEGRRLEESRSNLVEIFEATPDFVTMSPPDGSPQYVNAAARRALGIAEGDRIDSLLGYRKPEFQQQLLQTILPTARRDGTWRGETEYVSRSGQVIPVSQVSVAHKDVNGNVRMLSTISRDITDRLAEQVKLRDAEERLRFALEASGVGVWEVNMQTGVAYWSETCEAMHGLTRGTFAGSTGAFLSCIHEDDRKDVLNAVERAVRSQRDATLEYRTVWPDGRVRAISSTGRFVRDASGVPLRGAGIAMDITERRSLEAQLHQAQKMEAIGQLAGGIAHDFNNLTTAIIGYAGLLSDSLGSTDERRADVAEIERAAGRAADLTRQLLAFSRKQILQPRVLQLGRVVIELAPMLRRLLGEAIDLRTVIADRGSVKADPGQIEQVIVNIAVNARDAMPTGGRLTIETGDIAPEEPETNPRQDARDCPSVFLAISDTGHGMDRATLQRVFEPFFTTKPTGRGTGLGLATAHGIVTQSGGSIDVSSEVGQGTTFRIIFPRTEERPDRPAIEQVDQPVPRGTEVILLVEDEQAVREFVHRVLTHHGYRVHAFAEPSRAVAFGKAHQSTVDLVLTDVVLPEIDGRTMALEISKCHPEVTVLYMSGYAEAAIVEGGVLEPGLFFIEKPFTAEALLWKVRELLEQPRTRPIGMRATDGRSREAARRPAAPFTS